MLNEDELSRIANFCLFFENLPRLASKTGHKTD